MEHVWLAMWIELFISSAVCKLHLEDTGLPFYMGFYMGKEQFM